ncbi:MAG: DUF4037 domain-containing protein [Candidatus Hodarchaeales archaeon]
MKENLFTPVNSIEDIDDPIAKKKLVELIKEPHVMGVMLWGSRATGFGTPNTDWDVLIYVTDDFFQTLHIKDIAIILFDENTDPKRLVCDFSYLSDKVFQQQLESPLDVDHFAYAEGVVIHDQAGGKLEEWRRKLARYPEDEHVERLKIKLIQLNTAFYYARVNEKRGFKPDQQVNLYRSITIAVNLWFTLQKTWSPPFKWWTKHVKRLGMDDETYDIFCEALKDPSIKTVEKLVDSLNKLAKKQGYDFKNFQEDFLETIMPTGRPKLIKHGYM